ncbi:hypothetical protein [Pseudomonas japonica]|uniref:hypothetical protein n=1 Tax=Pseudomonas japonica TaxID=256466 RepID=UPI001132467B|nr:hypothetical protein [Pseudomonas japonica]
MLPTRQQPAEKPMRGQASPPPTGANKSLMHRNQEKLRNLRQNIGKACNDLKQIRSPEKRYGTLPPRLTIRNFADGI